MKTLHLALGATLLAVAACSGGGGKPAPLLGDLGTGGTRTDASAGGANGGGSASGGSGNASEGGLGNNGGGTTNGGAGNGGSSGNGGEENGGTAGTASGGSGQTGGANGTGGVVVIGSGSGGSDGGKVVECTLSSGVVGCDSCVQRHCNAPCVTCQGNSECNAILECILTDCFTQQGTVNQQCAGSCETAHPSGTADFNDFIVNPDACARTYCEGFCNFF
jgi:hypothetical protein